MERTIKLPASPSESIGVAKILPDFEKIAALASDLGVEEITIRKYPRQ